MPGTGLPAGRGGGRVLLQPAPIIQQSAADTSGWKALASFGNNLAEFGEKLAVREAKEEGDLAVVRDEQGRLTVQLRDPLTASDEAYNKAAMARYLAHLETDTRAKQLEIAQQYREDPQGGDAAFRGYIDGTLKSVDRRVGEHAVDVLERARVETMTRLYENRRKQDLALTADALTSRLNLAEDDVLSLALNGGAHTPEWTKKVDEANDIRRAAVASGLISADRARIDQDRLLSRAIGESVVGQAGKLHERHGLEIALGETRQALRNPALKLSPQEIERFEARAEAHLNDLEKMRARLDAEGRQAAAADYTQRLTPFQRRLVEGKVTRLELEDAYQDGAGWLKPHDYINALQVVQKADERAAATAAQFRRVEHAGQPFAARVALAESGGRADATNPRSTATGAGQFIESTWLDVIKRHAPDVAAGKTDAQLLDMRKDPTLSLKMIDAYRQDNTKALAAKGLPTDDGALYLAHVLGAGGAATVLGAAPETPLRDLLPGQVLEANPFMRTMRAQDIRGWAASKVGAGEFLDPRSTDDRKAVDLHYGALSARWKNLPASEKQALDIDYVERTGMVPTELAGQIRGTLRRGAAAQKVEAAQLIEAIQARAPWARHDLDGDDFALAASINAWLDSGTDAVEAVARAEQAQAKAGTPEWENRARIYRADTKKVTAANLSFLRSQGERFGLFNDVPVTAESALTADFNRSVEELYLSTGDMEVARKVAWRGLERVWGETRIGGRRFEKYAPEAVYRNGKDPAWIEEQLFADLASVGTAAPSDRLRDRIRLQPDFVTGRQDAPSYVVLEKDDAGVWGPVRGKDGRPLTGPDGKPLRWRPNWNTSPAAERERTAALTAVERARAARSMIDPLADAPQGTAGMFAR